MINKNIYFVFNFVLVIAFILSSSFQVKAQLDDAGEILRAGADDANILLENYLKPFGEGFGADLNTGWFHTAKTHKTLGFDLTMNISAALVPNSAQTMDLNELLPQFSQLEYISGSMAPPTVSGDDNSDTELGIYYTNPVTDQREPITSFTTPQGTGFPYVPAPTIQASVGVIKDTDISLRYVPEVEFPGLKEGETGKVNLFGLGVKHGINQWLPADILIPVDLSVQFGYTQFKSNVDFNITPQVDNDTKNGFPESTWDGQGLELETSASTFNIIAGKSIPVLSVYAGFGFENSKTTILTPGAYPVTAPNPDYNPSALPGDPDSNTKRIERIKSPIDIEIEGSNSMRVFGGIQIKLAIVHISANYTQSDYSSFNIGAGISFR